MATHYTLDPALPVLLRPDGCVQIGWHPRRAVRVHPPEGLSATGLAAVLRLMQSRAALPDLLAAGRDGGLADAGELTALVDQLVASRLATVRPASRRVRSASIRVHGRGPLSDLLAHGLACSGARVKHTSQTGTDVTADRPDLVVLSDVLVVDPRVIRELHNARVPHLPVRVRDGTGLVGPMVIPGVTSCLACADLHRSDRDAAWPALAAQLRDTVGSAGRATVLATAALALDQVDRVLRVVHNAPGQAPPPPTLDATLECDVTAGTIVARRWQRHPRCSC